MIRLGLLGSLILLVGCGSSSIKIDTTPPGAEVFVRTIGASERRSAGKTPIPRTAMAEFQKGQKGAMMIEIEKENFLPASVLIAETGNTDTEIALQLKPSVNEADKGDTAKLNKNLDQLFEAQRLARIGRLDDAIKGLDEVGKVYPQWASVPEMKGGVFFLQKEYNKSLDEYRRAALLNPDNVSTQQIIKRLETKFGAKGSAPAAPAAAAAAKPPSEGSK